MYEKNLTVCEMVLHMINGYHFSVAEETAIRKALDGKAEAEKRMDEIFRKCASEKNKFKSSDSSRQRSVADEEMQEYLIYPQSFETSNMTPRVLIERNGIRFINNPYTNAESEMIKEWVEDHPYDVRGLAVGLWLSGGITPEAIIQLKAKDFLTDCKNANKIIYLDNCAVDKGIFQRWDRFRIVKRAMEQHQEHLPYVFMYQDKSGWHKLNGNAIQMKMVHICGEIGIAYQGFSNNELILS